MEVGGKKYQAIPEFEGIHGINEKGGTVYKVYDCSEVVPKEVHVDKHENVIVCGDTIVYCDRHETYFEVCRVHLPDGTILSKERIEHSEYTPDLEYNMFFKMIELGDGNIVILVRFLQLMFNRNTLFFIIDHETGKMIYTDSSAVLSTDISVYGRNHFAIISHTDSHIAIFSNHGTFALLCDFLPGLDLICATGDMVFLTNNRLIMACRINSSAPDGLSRIPQLWTYKDLDIARLYVSKDHIGILHLRNRYTFLCARTGTVLCSVHKNSNTDFPKCFFSTTNSTFFIKHYSDGSKHQTHLLTWQKVYPRNHDKLRSLLSGIDIEKIDPSHDHNIASEVTQAVWTRILRIP